MKQRGLLFHNKYFAWFKKVEIKNKDQEGDTGTYLFFDYEKDWCQKKKREFYV